jgi:hypothetical protein
MMVFTLEPLRVGEAMGLEIGSATIGRNIVELGAGLRSMNQKLIEK